MFDFQRKSPCHGEVTTENCAGRSTGLRLCSWTNLRRDGKQNPDRAAVPGSRQSARDPGGAQQSDKQGRRQVERLPRQDERRVKTGGLKNANVRHPLRLQVLIDNRLFGDRGELAITGVLNVPFPLQPRDLHLLLAEAAQPLSSIGAAVRPGLPLSILVTAPQLPDWPIAASGPP